LHEKNNDSYPLPDAYLEPHFGNESVGKKAFKGFHTPVHIRIHSVRKRLCDADGISAKAAIDGIVKAGLLQDDSTKFVKEVRYSQEKTKGPEYTVITLETE